MPDFLQTIIFVTGVAGQLLVAHKNTAGFWMWIICNIALISVSAKQGLSGMVALYVFYTAMCFYSIWQWGKPAPAIKENQAIELTGGTRHDTVRD